jgi:hypothetical protein
MGDTTEDLSAKLKVAAEKVVGKQALKSKNGVACFALPDRLLRSVGAETAHDGDVVVDRKADYDWGDEVGLDAIQPGYVLQFRDHVVEKWIDIEYRDGRTYQTTQPATLNRPHHSAIVIEVHEDGSVTVVEQNVRPHPNKVTRNVIPWLPEGEKPTEVHKYKDRTERIRYKVTGKVRVYRPVLLQKKEGMLLRPRMHPDGRRALAMFVPSQGGSKRTQGPIGIDVPTRARWPNSGEPGWPDDGGVA